MTETVQVTIQASKLPCLEKAQEQITNPFSIITLLPNGTNSQQATILGKTEVYVTWLVLVVYCFAWFRINFINFFLSHCFYSIHNSRNPSWTKAFFVNYDGGNKATYFLVKIFNEVRENEYKELGSGVFEIGEILRLRNNNLSKRLKGGGTIDVCVRKVVGIGSLNLKMSGDSLKNPRGLRKKISPFYQLSRKDVGPR